MSNDGRIRTATLRTVGRQLLARHWTDAGTASAIEEAVFRVLLEEHTIPSAPDAVVPSLAEASYRHLLGLVLSRADPVSPAFQDRWVAAVAADVPGVVTTLLHTDPFQRAPERWRALEQEEERTREILEHAKDLLATSSGYTCRNRKCKSKRFRTDTAQIRSADEAMTTMIRCLECGTGWSEN